MEYEFVTYEKDDRVATITFNAPKRFNAFNATMKKDFLAALKQAEADNDIRVIVVTGAGDRAFSTGYDLNDSVGITPGSVSEWRARLEDDYDFTFSVWKCPKPVIARIHGHCLAGALEFAQMCDVRYCSDDARFGVVESRFSAGVVTLVMPWIIGARARELIYTGDTIGADEAHHMGLVNRVFPKEQLNDEVTKIAKRMSLIANDCLQWNKRALNHTMEAMGFQTAMRYGLEACTMLDSTSTPEHAEFSAVRRERGVKEALKWRDAQFRAHE